MNPAVFATPPASACTPGTAGAQGPDRIARSLYDQRLQARQAAQAEVLSAEGALTNAKLDNALSPKAMFAQANLANASLVKIRSREALFAEAIAPDADFTGADLSMTVFLKSSCIGAKFVDANLTYAELSHGDYTNADFSGATLTRARIHKIKDEGATFGINRMAAFGTDDDIAQAEEWQPPPA